MATIKDIIVELGVKTGKEAIECRENHDIVSHCCCADHLDDMFMCEQCGEHCSEYCLDCEIELDTYGGKQ